MPPGHRASPAFPADDAPLYTVGQVADMLGVQPAYLRRLDAHDVVRPSRSTGRQRRYSRLEIDRIDVVISLMGEGMTLAGAQRIVELQAEIDDAPPATGRAEEPPAQALNASGVPGGAPLYSLLISCTARRSAGRLLGSVGSTPRHGRAVVNVGGASGAVGGGGRHRAGPVPHVATRSTKVVALARLSSSM